MKKAHIVFAMLIAFNFLNNASSGKTHTVLCHGVVDTGLNQLSRYDSATNDNNRSSIFGETSTFDFPDAQPSYSWWPLVRTISFLSSLFKRTKLRPNGKMVDRAHWFLGQDKDLECLSDHIKTIQKDKDLILYGCSRGGSAAINYAAENNPQVKALALESPVADMLDGPRGMLWGEPLFRFIFYKYPQNPTPPVEAIKDIQDKALPIFIIYTPDDTTVHQSQAWKLYCEFKEQGFKNVYIKEFPQGRHCYLFLENVFETHYCDPIKAFYDKHKLHAEKFGRTKDLLDDCQPTLKEAQAKRDELLTEKQKSDKKKSILIASFTAICLASTLALAYKIYTSKK